MKKIIYFFTLFNFCVNAQMINGKILSEDTNLPLSYITIYSGDSNYLTITDSIGNFTFKANKDLKEIFVDTQGYELKRIDLSNINPNDLLIFLKEEIIQLNEVSILNNFNHKKNVGNSGSAVHIDFNPISDQNRIREIAVKLNTKDLAKVDNINIGFSKLPKNINTSFRLTIYDEKNGLPNSIISKQDLLYEISENDLKNNIFSIPLKEKNIYVKGVFYISIEIFNELEESIWFSAGFLGKNGYMRRNYKDWDRMPLKLSPYINVDLLLKDK